MSWVDAQVEVQGTALVVKDAETGNCFLVDLSTHPHTAKRSDLERVETVFGSEVFEDV